jgi:hypothetical protein
MDDLLALRAGEASVWARRHIEDCEQCARELDAVYQRVAALKALPAFRPARDVWPAVREAARATRRQRARRVGAGVTALAAAAALAGVLISRGPVAPAGDYVDEIARIKRQSAALEDDLARIAPEGRVTSGREAAWASLLEDRIAVLDGELVQAALPEAATSEPQLLDLWQERVELMRQLYTVRATRAAYMGL